MSDYLWDKSGEPDSEVERLEGLLGRLRHSQSAPALTLEVGAHAPARVGLFRHAFYSRPARLAAAAALLLAVLAGALVMLRQTRTSDGGRASVTNETPSEQRQAGTREEASAPAAAASTSKESGSPDKPTPGVERRGAAPEAAQSFPPVRERRGQSPREAVAGVRSREAFEAAASFTNRAREPRAGVGRAGFEGASFDMESRLRAKERLVYAMRLTSEALREVRGRAAGADVRAESFDARNPPR
jgi:negative regulator of sigma E activity